MKWIAFWNDNFTFKWNELLSRSTQKRQKLFIQRNSNHCQLPSGKKKLIIFALNTKSLSPLTYHLNSHCQQSCNFTKSNGFCCPLKGTEKRGKFQATNQRAKKYLRNIETSLNNKQRNVDEVSFRIQLFS